MAASRSSRTPGLVGLATNATCAPLVGGHRRRLRAGGVGGRRRVDARRRRPDAARRVRTVARETVSAPPATTRASTLNHSDHVMVANGTAPLPRPTAGPPGPQAPPGPIPRDRYPRGVIDLRELRDNPDVVRASQRARGDDPALVDVVLEADQRRRAALTEFERLRAEQKSLGKQVATAHGRGEGRAPRPDQGARPGRQGPAGGRRRRRDRPDGDRPPDRQRRRRRRPARRRGRLRRAARGGHPPRLRRRGLRPARPPRARRGCSARSTPSAARRCPARGSTSSPASARGSSSRCSTPPSTRPSPPVSRRSSPRRSSSPRSWPAPGSSARTPTRCTAWTPTTCTSSAPARSRWPATTRNEILDLSARAAAVRGLVGLLPPGGRLVRQGHPRHHPRAPVPQGRDVQLRLGRGRRGRARAAARLGGGDARSGSSCPTG